MSLVLLADVQPPHLGNTGIVLLYCDTTDDFAALFKQQQHANPERAPRQDHGETRASSISEVGASVWSWAGSRLAAILTLRPVFHGLDNWLRIIDDATGLRCWRRRQLSASCALRIPILGPHSRDNRLPGAFTLQRPNLPFLERAPRVPAYASSALPRGWSSGAG